MREACDVVVDASGALLAAVAGVREIVLSGANAAESQGTLPRATADALLASGLLAMKLPVVLGGWEADLAVQVQVIEALAYLDPAAGWCQMVGASAIGWPGAFLTDEALAVVFRDGRWPHASVVVQPTGTAVALDDGYRLSGRWSFASGIRHAEWITAGALVRGRQGRPPVHVMAVFPAAAAQVCDDWQVAGLEGTGSCSFIVEELFVAAAFTWDFASSEPRRGGALYRLGWPGFVAHEPAAFALGIARRALDEIVAVARAHDGGVDQRPLALSPTLRYTVGEADIRLRAARALVMEVCGAMWSVVCAGETPSPKLQAELRSVSAFTTHVATDIATQAFRAGGSRAVYRTSVLQRCLRSIAAAGQHWLARDDAHEIYGRFVLEPPEPRRTL
jgi:alkylation response protein AidB-like acyl-CoA dehydrogenase